jgi:hypothetical protein
MRYKFVANEDGIFLVDTVRDEDVFWQFSEDNEVTFCDLAEVLNALLEVVE